MENDNYIQLESNNTCWAYTGCYSCGKPVRVLLPFVGCVYCEECMKGDDDFGEAFGSENFVPRYV